MEPIRETRQVLARLSKTVDEDLVERFTMLSSRVGQVVPDCVGMSLSLMPEDLTFTWLSSSFETSQLDAVQYLDGGPCVESSNIGNVIEIDSLDACEEAGWHTFALSAAAAGVRSSLSLPLRDGGAIRGGVNLYASSHGGFAGKVTDVADIFGGWAEEAVSNADLGFATRHLAEEAPERLADIDIVGQAVGLMVAAYRIDVDQARERLTQAADRAGLSETQLAEELLKRGFGLDLDT